MYPLITVRNQLWSVWPTNCLILPSCGRFWRAPNQLGTTCFFFWPRTHQRELTIGFYPRQLWGWAELVSNFGIWSCPKSEGVIIIFRNRSVLNLSRWAEIFFWCVSKGNRTVNEQMLAFDLATTLTEFPLLCTFIFYGFACARQSFVWNEVDGIASVWSLALELAFGYLINCRCSTVLYSSVCPYFLGFMNVIFRPLFFTTQTSYPQLNCLC